MATLPTHLIDAEIHLRSIRPTRCSRRQREIIDGIAALTRRQHIVVSHSSVSSVKWAAILPRRFAR
jgi:hypothetical protein